MIDNDSGIVVRRVSRRFEPDETSSWKSEGSLAKSLEHVH
jgi:hypothetical protein